MIINLKDGAYGGVPKFIAETMISLRAFPYITMKLKDLFEKMD